MNATEAMERIEGHPFSGIVNLASDFRTFLRILGSQPEVKVLAEGMKAERVTADVLRRLLELAATPVEEGFEHPADAALAAYLWLLSNGNSEDAQTAAEAILGCKQCWWSRKMAEHVRSAPGPQAPVDAGMRT
jgi:hypothetical protein